MEESDHSSEIRSLGGYHPNMEDTDEFFLTKDVQFGNAQEFSF
jgi:hypothetical protein